MSTSNLAKTAGLAMSVSAKSINILMVSGTDSDSPSLLIKEKANLSSSVGEFLEKSTFGEVKCIWFPESITIWSTPPEPPPSRLKSESFPWINIALFKNLGRSYLFERSKL